MTLGKDLVDELQDLFDYVDRLSIDMGKEYHGEEFNALTMNDIQDYWSDYNCWKRLTRQLLQTNRRIMELLNPTPFREAQERSQNDSAHAQTKCIQCGCYLEKQENLDKGICISCIKTYGS